MSLEDNPSPEPEEKPVAEPVVTLAPVAEKKKNRFTNILLIVLGVLLLAGGTGLGIKYFHDKSQESTLVDLNGNTVVPEDPSATSSPFMAAADMVVNDGGDGFRVPSIKLKVAIGSVNDVNGVMNPPNFQSVFWVRNRGVSLDNAEQGTVFMVTHAVQGGSAPGNIMQAKGQVVLKPGDTIQANQRTYEYESSQIIPKTEIGDHEDIWANTPGRLLVITCVLNPAGGIAVDNMVIVAKLVS